MKDLTKILSDETATRETRMRQGKVTAVAAGPPRTLTATVAGVSVANIRVMDHVDPIVNEGVWLVDVGKGRWLCIGTNSNVQTAPTFAGGKINLVNGTSNMLMFNTAGVAPPAFSTRSAGTKIVFYPGVSGSAADYAMGIDGSTLWFSTPTTSEAFRWYGGTSNVMTLTSAGALTTGGRTAMVGWSSTGENYSSASIGLMTGYLYSQSATSNWFRPFDGANLHVKAGTGNCYYDGANHYFRNAGGGGLMTIDASGNAYMSYTYTSGIQSQLSSGSYFVIQHGNIVQVNNGFYVNDGNLYANNYTIARSTVYNDSGRTVIGSGTDGYAEMSCSYSMVLGSSLGAADGSYPRLMRNPDGGALIWASSTRASKERVRPVIEAVDPGSIIDKLTPVEFYPAKATTPGLAHPDRVNEPGQLELIHEWQEVERHFGFIAEDVNEVDPWLAQFQVTDDGLKAIGWREPDILALAIAEIQSLRKRISQLEGVNK